MALTKDANMSPWKYGSARWSELPIEQWFSFIRAQSSNAQVSARGYFKAASRVMLKHGQKLEKEEPVFNPGEPPLTEEELLGSRWPGVFRMVVVCKHLCYTLMGVSHFDAFWVYDKIYKISLMRFM